MADGTDGFHEPANDDLTVAQILPKVTSDGVRQMLLAFRGVPVRTLVPQADDRSQLALKVILKSCERLLNDADQFETRFDEVQLSTLG